MRRRMREGESDGGEGKGEERRGEQPPAAAASTSGLINLMVSEDSEGLSEDGGGRRGSTSL